jgi:phosphoserine phosphatase
MINKDQVLTIVGTDTIQIEEISKQLAENYNINIASTKQLSNNAYDVVIPAIEQDKIKELRKVFFQQKKDCCFQSIDNREKKILLSDMDATIIENETLDDLVKISGVTANIDETSRLAMEGKIDIRTTLSLRVNFLKNKPKSLIDQVLVGIKFHPGSKTLVQTLNAKGFITSLITGGFAPISTYVGNKLGFQNIVSNEFKFENDKFTGEYIPITGEKNSKLNYLNKLTTEKNIDKSKVVAVGDGANDLGMLTNVGLGLGYHAHEIVRKQVENQIFFNDLTTILYYLGLKKEEFNLD